MNYYQFHIGDYASATRHLSWDEDAAYRRLLDVYYKTEKPIPTDMGSACRLVLAQTDQQREAVATVLHEFFVLTDDGWINSRADAEIHTMLSKQQSQRDKANKRWNKPGQEHGNATAYESDAVASRLDAVAMPPIPVPAPIPVPEKEVTSSSNVVGAAEAAKPKKATSLPPGWRLPKAWGEWALAEFPHWTADTVRVEAEKFADHWATKIGKDARKADWQATWRNWCRSDIAQRAHRPGTRPNQMTAEQREACAQQEDEKARRLLFGDVLDVESSPVLGISNL